MKCIVCNKEYNTNLGLIQHVSQTHNMSSQEYYNLVYGEHKCNTCGKPTKYINFTKGYKTYCSAKCAANNINTKEKRIKTNIIKYGCANVSQSETIKAKKLNTYMQHLDETKEKVKRTNNEKYGCDWVTQSENFKQKAKQTCLEKYNVDNYAKSDQYKKKIKETRSNYMNEMINKGFIPLQEINAKYGTGWNQQNIDKITTYKNKGYVDSKYLPEIEEYSSRTNSKFQSEVFNFINMPDAVSNTRSIIPPLELDIFIPSYKLAIECDGIYWHNKTDKNYHLHKTKLCDELGIRLIHITDWQWNNQRPICESIINSALNRYETKIYARKCTIKNVSNQDAKNFLNKNHIQGGINAAQNIGLFYNDELVQLISLGKSRYKKSEYELYRMCTKLNTQVIGGFNKLLNQINQPIISYVDRSLFNGQGYINTGWSLIAETPPSYSYYKQNIKLSRTQTQKHKLPNILDNFNPNITEKQNMINNNWLIVYDCGTLKFERK